MSHQPANGDGPPQARTVPLFNEFDAPTYAAWREATIASLKGLPFEKLISHTYEAIDLQPLYRAEDIAGLGHVNTVPGKPPFVRGSDAAGYLVIPWTIAQEIAGRDPADFNRRLLHDLKRGQNAVNLAIADGADAGVALADAATMAVALHDVDLNAVPILLRAGADALPATALLLTARPEHAALHGAIDNDPLGELASDGSLPAPLAHLYDEMAALVQWATSQAPGLRTISVHGDRFHDAGADAVTELAAVLATGVAYLRALQARELTVDQIAKSMTFVFGLGSNFFMEIAKLRAARLLWSQVVAAFGGSTAAQAMTIHARTADWNKTSYDPYVNMLRVTTEAFAGALGGVQSMHVAPFDVAVRSPDEFSHRIARNTQLILQSECNLTHLVDPAGGSWYVEWLTDRLAQAAWQRFQRIEADGGMTAVLAAGTLQQQIAESAQARAAALARRKDVMVGINMYPQVGETRLEGEAQAQAKAETETEAEAEAKTETAEEIPTFERKAGADLMQAVAAAAADGATLAQLRDALRREQPAGPTVEPLVALRVAAPFEALREAADSYAAEHGSPPRVFLANMGPLVQHKARADFTQGFVNVGGFVCDYPTGFASVEDATSAALGAGAQAVVICSTDDTYPEIVPALAAQIKEAAPDLPLLLAGYPAEHEEAFRAAGVNEFIHLRADCYAVNAWLQEQLGIQVD